MTPGERHGNNRTDGVGRARGEEHGGELPGVRQRQRAAVIAALLALARRLVPFRVRACVTAAASIFSFLFFPSVVAKP